MEKTSLSRSKSVDKPSFLKEYTSWIIEHKLTGLMLIAIGIVIGAIEHYFGILYEYAIHTLIIAFVVVAVTLGYFYWTKWRTHMLVLPWYGHYDDQVRFRELIASSDSTSLLVVTISLGPSVGSWTVRFRVSRDFILVDYHAPRAWTKTKSTELGILCLSSVTTEPEVTFKFSFQAKCWPASGPKSSVFLEFVPNIQPEKFPSNKESCRDLTVSEILPIPVNIVPPS